MRVLITRAENEAPKMAKMVEDMGHTPLVASMIEIKLEDTPLDLEGVQGLVLTSANGARALAKMTEDRDIRLFCVGPQSEKKAESLGFTNTVSSIGNMSNLVIFIQRNAKKDGGPLVYLHGDHVSGNPVQDLRKAGFQVGARRVYAAAPVKELNEKVIAAFEGDTPPEVATFLSIRSFKIFLEAAKKAGLTGKLRDVIAVCISPAVADFARGVRWKNVISAEEVSLPSIIDAIKGLQSDDQN